MQTIKDNCFINLGGKKKIWTCFIVVCEQLITEGFYDLQKPMYRYLKWNVLESVCDAYVVITFFVSFYFPLLFCDLVDLEYLSFIWTWQSSEKSH